MSSPMARIITTQPRAAHRDKSSPAAQTGRHRPRPDAPARRAPGALAEDGAQTGHWLLECLNGRGCTWKRPLGRAGVTARPRTSPSWRRGPRVCRRGPRPPCLWGSHVGGDKPAAAHCCPRGHAHTPPRHSVGGSVCARTNDTSRVTRRRTSGGPGWVWSSPLRQVGQKWVTNLIIVRQGQLRLVPRLDFVPRFS